MNISIDAIANFNPVGAVKPLFIRLEDENHELHTYKIETIKQTKEENISGIHALIFKCGIEEQGMMRDVTLRYHCRSHKWSLIEP